MKKLLLILTMLAGIIHANAQNKLATGKVLDLETGEPLVGVTVLEKGTSNGVITNPKGEFTLQLKSAQSTLVFSFIGMESVEKQMGTSPLKVNMKTSTIDVDEVIITAYGSIRKGANTSSSSQVNFDKFKDRPLTNIASAIEGSTSGINLTSSNGQPGSAPSLRIRGFGSINASNDPLYVVDGAPFSGNLSDINMDDVQSFTILKDASATALYGSRGSNGVVIITTKKGSKERGQLSLKATQGFTSRGISEYERVSAQEYYPLQWQALRNNLIAQGQTPQAANTNASSGIVGKLGYNPFNVPNNEVVLNNGALNPDAQLLWANDLDWNKELIRRGSRKETNLTYSGGGEKSDFYAALGYLSEKGYLINTNLDKFSARVNVNANPVKWLKTGINLASTRSEANYASDVSNSTGYSNPFFFTRIMGPIYPVYTHNQSTGEYLLNEEGNRYYDYGNQGGAGIGVPNRPSSASPGRHVVEETKLNKRTGKRTAISTRAYFDFIITKDLTFKTSINSDISYYNSSVYENKKVGDGAPAGRLTKNQNDLHNFTFNQILNYTKSFKQHNLTALLGHENYDFTYSFTENMAQGQIADGIYELNNFTTLNSFKSYTDKYRTEGYFSRINYDFKERYFLSASIRRDGNSRFKKEYRWDNFWSMGGAWRIDKEPFFKVDFVDMLKLRASYGRVGNDAGIGYYPYQGLYALGINNAQEAGILQNSLANDDLTWEGSKSADMGLEFGILKNRITGSVEYYSRLTDDLIFNVKQPYSLGGYTMYKNIGAMVNEGLEIQLSAIAVANKHFTWTIGFNGSTLKNRITKMPSSQPEIINGSKKLAEGHSIYDFWLKDWQGVDPADGSPLYRANQPINADGSLASNVRIRSVGDTVTTNQNNARYTYAGSAIPDFTGSLSNAFKYKNLELSFLVSFQMGGQFYDNGYASLMSSGSYGRALHKDALNAWQEPGDITNVPRMDASNTTSSNASSTRWLTDASYWSLRNVTLAYDLPKLLLRKMAIQKLRFFVSADNLYLSSARVGLDPQQNFNGTSSNTYVPSRIFTAGLNLNF